MKNRAERVRLGEFEVDFHTGGLLATGSEGEHRRIVLRQQPLDVLRMLIEGEGEIVTRQEIQKKLWPNDTIVNFDHSINVAIGILRRAMGDSADNPQYIETLARRGYRLRVPVQWVGAQKEATLPEPASPLPPTGWIGMKVSHYRVLEFIGAGGMGMVYRAEDIKLTRRVALKFLPEEMADDPLALKRFEREAQTASALNHPNICTIYQIDEHGGQPFIAMELLEGESLLECLATREAKATPLSSLLDIAIGICDGLQAAHDEGIVHRDIKPGNLFLTRQGPVKILDFGLAQAISSEEPGSEPPMGTTGYMSPEQLRKERLDPRSDLFSFGIVLYEMTTGRRPFGGDTLAAIHDAILTQTLPPAHAVNPAVPRRLSAIMAKATEKDRNRRYQSAAEIRADLECVRQEVHTKTPHTRKWLVAGGLVASAALAIGLLARFHNRVPPLSPNETIVIGIQNQTRDPAFDDALYVPLGIAMEQTPYFTALSLTKAAPAFNALHLSGDPMKLSPQTARQVCVHAGGKLVIAGSIAEAGNGFGIELRAIECQSERTIATASAEARSRTQVVHALGLAAVDLRGKLGEPQASIARFNKPLDTAASASPEALEMLLEGYKRNLVLDLRGAVSNYQRALELDPNLAAALTSFAATQDNLGDEASSIAAARRAYALRDRLTDPVRSHAENLYYDIVTGEREKQCAVLSQFLLRFPDDYIAHTNFGRCLYQVGQQDGALAEAREASRLYPSPFSYGALTFREILSDRLSEAEALFAEADAQQFDSAGLRQNRAMLAFLQHDNSKMEEQWRWAEGKPGADYLMLRDRALAEAYYGHYSNYRNLSARARDLAARENALPDVTWYRSTDALAEAEAGDLTQALQTAEKGLNEPQHRVTTRILALALARAGQTTRAQELADSINKTSPVDTVVQNYLLPTIQAAIRIHAKDPAEAIKILERTRKYEFAVTPSFSDLYPAYIRGLAYLQMGDGPLARIEFQKLLDHPGFIGHDVIGALSHLQMARALKASGDMAAARKSYEDFLDLWKNADPDIPIYRQAKAEYSELPPPPATR
jgi:serine/threonine protein kinase/tetratricopeptide (TPR) repeat protein